MQRELLDRYADAASELRAVQEAWRNARDAREALVPAKSAADAIARNRTRSKQIFGTCGWPGQMPMSG